MKDTNAVSIGRKGGIATLNKKGRKHFKMLADKRWGKQRVKKKK